jgi:NitT/TauT family transport system substrate-binding protein
MDRMGVMKLGRLAFLAGTVVVFASLAAACSGSSGSTTSTASASLLSSSECSSNQAAGTITYISPFAYDASAGIIDAFAAQKLGYFKDMCLNVAFVTNSQTSTELVAAGRGTTSSIGSAADFLQAVSQGSNIEAVATYGDTSDYALLTQPDITSIPQLDGKTFGYHATVPVIILEMFHAAGLDPTTVHQINTFNYDPNQLIQGLENSIQAYQSNEPLTLRSEGAHFNEFIPSQFGIHGTFNVQLFNKDFYKAHKTAVADYMRAQLHAFDYCSTHQSQCISIEQQYAQQAGATYDTAHEAAEWRLESALALGHTVPNHGVGVETTAEWQPEAKALVQYGVVNSLPPLSSVEDTTIVANLYNGKTLVWP